MYKIIEREESEPLPLVPSHPHPQLSHEGFLCIYNMEGMEGRRGKEREGEGRRGKKEEEGGSMNNN